MQSYELLQALENNGTEVLNNNDTIDAMSIGCETCTLFGEMDGDFIANKFTQEMPDPSDGAVNITSKNPALPDFSPPSNDTPEM